MKKFGRHLQFKRWSEPTEFGVMHLVACVTVSFQLQAPVRVVHVLHCVLEELTLQVSMSLLEYKENIPVR